MLFRLLHATPRSRVSQAVGCHTYNGLAQTKAFCPQLRTPAHFWFSTCISISTMDQKKGHMGNRNGCRSCQENIPNKWSKNLLMEPISSAGNRQNTSKRKIHTSTDKGLMRCSRCSTEPDDAPERGQLSGKGPETADALGNYCDLKGTSGFWSQPLGVLDLGFPRPHLQSR